jgi:FdrA protein
VTSFVEVRPGAYRDSVALMQVSRDLSALDGVSAALVAMATALNLDLLVSMGFDRPASAGPNDLVVAISAEDDEALRRARATLNAALSGPGGRAARADSNSARRPGSAITGLEPPAARLTAGAIEGASIALISVPGQYAFAEAVDALDGGLPVMIFSDNVPIEQEVWLKTEATRRGLLVMGPDSGTALVSGVGLGFANVVAPGPVGIVAASGTGAQQLMCLLAAADVGISHCLGVGGRDLSAAVGGRSTIRALDLLDADISTELVVVIAKSPDHAVAAMVSRHAAGLSKPVLLGFSGERYPDLTAVATGVLDTLGRSMTSWPRWTPPNPLPRRSGALRGLYAGGTLRDEALEIAGSRLGRIAIDDPSALGHLLVDFGDDRFTVGRAHPMIDPLLRADQLGRDLANPATGVVIVDVVLGHGAHPSPATAIADAVNEAVATGEIVPPVVAALIGTTADPQGLAGQAQLLVDAGARVFLSHAEAVRTALHLLTGEDR